MPSSKTAYLKLPNGKYKKYHITGGAWGVSLTRELDDVPRGALIVDKHLAGKAEGDLSYENLKNEYDVKYQEEQKAKQDEAEGLKIKEAEELEARGVSQEWGAANITKDMFVNPDGTQKEVKDIYATLDPILTNKTGSELVSLIEDMLPKYVGVSAEDKGFLEEETAQAFKGDVYGLQREAGKVGGAMGSVYGGGMGAGMRSGMAGQASMGKEFGMAEDAYDLAKRKGMYALEEQAEGQFERDVAGVLETDWFEDPAEGTQSTTAWGNFRGGGRVPNKDETFLHFLTQLPDAGGS